MNQPTTRDPTPNKISPWHRALLLVGSLGPLGHLPASGSATVVIAGVPVFWAMQPIPTTLSIAGLLAFSVLAVWLHEYGDKILRTKDSPTLVWDELVGFLIATAGVPFHWKTVILCVAIERAFDILKIQPARFVEQRFPRGWGVVGDDVVAGLYTCAIVHIALYAWPSLTTSGY